MENGLKKITMMVAGIKERSTDASGRDNSE